MLALQTLPPQLPELTISCTWPKCFFAFFFNGNNISKHSTIINQGDYLTNYIPLEEWVMIPPNHDVLGYALKDVQIGILIL